MLYYDTTMNMQEKSSNEREFYSLNEVAQKLGLSRMTIYRYVKSKKLAAYQFDRDFRVSKKDLDTFIAQFKV